MREDSVPRARKTHDRPERAPRVLSFAAALIFLLCAGCAAGDGSSSEGVRSPARMRVLDVEQISSGDRGLERQRVITAPSAAALAGASGVRVPDSGEGVYVAAFWGRKTTGGYAVSVESARVSDERITVQLALREPPPDAFVTQAITYPYAVAVVRGEALEGKQLLVEGEDGRELGWPVLRVGS